GSRHCKHHGNTRCVVQSPIINGISGTVWYTDTQMVVVCRIYNGLIRPFTPTDFSKYVNPPHRTSLIYHVIGHLDRQRARTKPSFGRFVVPCFQRRTSHLCEAL